MVKSKKSNLTMFLSVITLLVCLLLSLVNVTGAWFTDSSGTNKTINAIVKTGEANLNVYQEDSTGTQVALTKSLPTGYTQLEYIATTGTQYIDTGFKPNPSTVKYETTVSFDSTTDTRGVFGARVSGPSNQAVNVFCLGGKLRLDWADSASNTYVNAVVGKIYDFSCYQNKVIVNGTTYSGTTAKSTTALTTNFYIGNFSGTGSTYGGMVGKIYSGRLYDNGTLIRNYIPAKRTSDSVIGMYDTVGGKFYTNAGTGTFTAGSEALSGASVSIPYDTTNKTNNKLTLDTMPTGYTQLDYLEATGKQYIDTGYIPNADSKFDVTFLVNDANLDVDCPLFGARNNWENSYTFWCHGEGYSAASQLIFNGKTSSLGNFKLNVKHRLTVQNGNYTLNGTTTTFASVSSGSPANTNLILMGLNNGGTSIDSRRFVGYVYSFKIYDNNVIVRNFVPARNSAGVLGMYDTVGNKFYTNKGEGNFIAGESSNQLKLLLKNEDLGKSFGVRYKVEFFVATATGKKALSATVAGMTAPTSSTNGFKLNSDGWYYYQNNSGANVVFEPATSSAVTSKYLMTSFTIKSDATTDALLGGNAIYMQITVESITV